MDDFLDEENSVAITEQTITTPVPQEIIQSPQTTPTATVSTDPLVQDIQKPTDAQSIQKAKMPIIAPKKSLTKSLAMAAA